MFPCFRVLIILYMNPWKSQVAQATLIHVCMENILHPKKCSLPDAPHAIQPRHRPDLPGAACLVSGADRCSVSSVRACVSVCGLLWAVYLASGTACAAACAVQSVRVRWGLGVSTGGVYSRRPAPPGQSRHHRKNKKGFKKFAAGFLATKNFPQKQKDPYKGSVFCAILALQALKGRNLQ